MAQTRLDADSGFYWLPFNKFELQLYNIRHIQHHTGQLTDRLRQAAMLAFAGSGDDLKLSAAASLNSDAAWS